MLGMELSIYSRQIDEILSAREQDSQRAAMLLTRYASLNSHQAQDAFISALVHRLLTEHARRTRSARST
jgi:hypothetical protein